MISEKQVKRPRQPILRVNLKSWRNSWPDWASIALLFATLAIAVRSIESARWISPQPSLIMVLALAILTGLLLARSRLPTALTYVLAIVSGGIFTIWQVANLIPGSEKATKINQLANTLQSFWQAVTQAKPSDNTIHFAIFLTFFVWIMGFVSAWFILRRQNAWIAVALGTLTILVNLNNLTADYYRFFFLFLLAAMLLVSQTYLAGLRYWFKERRLSYLKRGIIPFIASILCLTIVAVSAAWYTPQVRVSRLETLASTRVLWEKNIADYFTNFLAAVPAKQPFLKSGDQMMLFLGTPFESDGGVQFIVTAEQASHWRTRVYDTYSTWGWTGSDATGRSLRQGSSNAIAEEPTKRQEMTYSVWVNLKTDILLVAGEFVSSDVPVSVQTINSPSFDINLRRPANESSLPADVASLARSLRAVQATNKQLNLEEIRLLFPADLTLTGVAGVPYNPPEESNTNGITVDSRQVTTVEVTRLRMGAGDTVTVTSPSLFKPGQSYTVTGSISTATPADLLQAGADYPGWITDYYLQLPATLPQRVSELSENITRNVQSPYEKAVAIEQYLSRMSYLLETKTPPKDADGVDYFLFVQKSGNCVYFASAMTVMLRAAGIPSRLAIGYLPGEENIYSGSYVVRGKHYHAWTEAYFPGYGWIEFDPTPATPGGVETVRHTTGGGSPDLLEDDDESFIANLGSGSTSSPATSRQQLPAGLRWTVIGILLVVLSAFTLSSAYRYWLKRFVGDDYACEVYAKLCFLASLAKIRPRPQQTPLEYKATLAIAFPLQAEALNTVTQAYLKSRFSRRKEPGPPTKELQNSWRQIYLAILKRLFRLKY